MVNGRLDYDMIAAVGEIVDRQAQAFHHTRDETQFFAGDFKIVAVMLPIDDGVPIGVGGGAVAKDGVVEAVAQSGSDFRAHGKIEVGNPERCYVVAAKHLVESV